MTGYERRKQHKKDQILRAAEELFKRQGFKKTTVDDVARLAGVSKVTIYNHFTDRRGLIEEALRKLTRDKIEQYGQILSSERPWAERLNAVVLDKYRLAAEYGGEVLETLYGELPDLVSEIREMQLKKQNEVTFSFLDEGRRLGFVPQHISNEAIAIYLECIYRGLDSNEQVFARLTDEPKLTEEIIDIITYGMIRKSPQE